MTQEEKVKAHYRIIERVGQLPTIESALSELKDNKDERIKDAAIEFIRQNNFFNYRLGISKEDVIAWLESKENSVRWNENTDGNKPQKNHSVLMKTTHGIAEGEWNGDDSWTQYRWSSSIKDSDVLFWIELSDLEKQDGQKQSDRVEPKFKIGDVIRFKGNETLKGEAETHKIVGYDNEAYVFADGTTDLFCEQDLYELVEQEQSDRVETKFHEDERGEEDEHWRQTAINFMKY